MAQEGCTYEDIAEELGISVDAARQRVYKYGIQHLHKIKKATKPRGNYFKPDEDELLIRAWRSGTSAAEIGVALGRSEGSIKTRIIKLRDKGIDLPYKKGPYNTGGNR